MANPVIDALKAAVARNTEVDASAVILINGIAERIQKAVTKALANGATAEELAPITDEIALFNSSTEDLAAAVKANTPAEDPVDPVDPPVDPVDPQDPPVDPNAPQARNRR